jgi:2,4-dienoyl-CoA reductase-like NADH-dependent reductase (Old Yellow Enzyme family)
MGYKALDDPIAANPLSDIAPGMLVADDPAMAASTVVPKGGVPYQPNIYTDQALEDFRKLSQPVGEHDAAVKRQIADDRSSIGNIAQSHMTTLANAELSTEV